MSLPVSDLTVVTGSGYGSRGLVYRSPELRSLGIGTEDYTLSVDKTRPSEERRGLLKELVLDSLRELGIPALNVEVRHNENIGLYAVAVLDCNARRALEYWLKIDRAKVHNIPVFITWTGDVDIPPEEMGIYIGKALAKMGVFLATEEPIDVVEIREEWSI